MARPKKTKTEHYLYSKRIRIIRDRTRVPLLFDEFQELTEERRAFLLKDLPDRRGFYLKGNIGGLPAKITYSETSSDFFYAIATQKPEHLSRVYNLALDRLLGVDNSNSNGKSLAEIMGLKST